MHIVSRKSFEKAALKLTKSQQRRLKEHLRVFVRDPFHPMLNNHELKGKYKNCRSINVTGDMRAIYTIQNGVVVFLTIGTHAELYG